MKKVIVIPILYILTTLIICYMIGCMNVPVSEGTKLGTLQKVSHKTLCDIYVAEFAYEGGKVQTVPGGKTGTFSNTQEFQITKEAYDTLSNYLGYIMVFGYKDIPNAICGLDKKLTSIKKK